MLSTPDGSRQYQVTTAGGYTDVSQADDGTMIALNGVRLHRLARDGTVLADFDTPVSDTRPAPSKTFYGPFDPAISPDGTKVAYTYYYMTQSQNPTLLPARPASTTINEGGTGYSYARSPDRLGRARPRLPLGLAPPVVGRQRHDADRPTRPHLPEPRHDPRPDLRRRQRPRQHGQELDFATWSKGNPHVGGGDITRDKRKIAFQTGKNDTTLTVYYVPPFPTSWRDGEPDAGSDPHVCYRYRDAPGGAFGVPTFSPDGSAIAWPEGDGIHVAAVPRSPADCTLDGATPTRRW